MNVLTRYLARALLKGWGITLLVIASVFGLLGFIGELDAAVGAYSPAAIGLYTVLILPQQMLSLAPVILLLGTILALSALQRGSELTVISCAGVPVSGLLRAIALPTAALMLLLWVAMELVTPPLHQRAEQLRLDLREGAQHRLPRGGVWSRDGRRYIHLGEMRGGREPGDISLYEFTEDGSLARALHADSALVGEDRRWRFRDVQRKQPGSPALRTEQLDALEIDNLWAARELPVLSLSPDSMRLSVLYSYGSYLAGNAREARAYLSAFWQRLALPLTSAAMVLLATAVSAGLGSRRSSNVGASLALGTLIGIGFYLGSQILLAAGQLLDLSLPLVALLPTLAVLGFAGLMLRRMHW